MNMGWVGTGKGKHNNDGLGSVQRQRRIEVGAAQCHTGIDGRALEGLKMSENEQELLK